MLLKGAFSHVALDAWELGLFKFVFGCPGFMCRVPWGAMSINNTYIGPQCIQIVPTLGYLEPLGLVHSAQGQWSMQSTVSQVIHAQLPKQIRCASATRNTNSTPCL